MTQSQTQLTTLIFVLLTIMSTSCFKISSRHNFIKTFLTQTKTSIAPSQENIKFLGRAAEYAVLAGTRTTNAGLTTVVGSIGVSPGKEINGDAIKLISGEYHAADAHSLGAQADLTTAYSHIENLQEVKNLTGTDLVGLTLSAGVYKFDVACALSSGTLYLDARGDASATWIFQIGTTLITEVNSTVAVINGGSALNVYWQVGSSATFKTDAVMVGNVIAYESISFGTNVALKGRALARSGAVTMLSNVIQVNP